MMGAKSKTGGLDWFRPVAALLVVAVHTGPLRSVSAGANYLITDILARLAVPFFFAVSGYFLVPKLDAQGTAALLPFLKKTAILYGVSTLLYLPIRFYSGYFQQPGLPGLILRDIFLDGTFYHLWYFPAAMLGACLVCLLLRLCRRPGVALGVCAGLYLLGLLGDSYFGLAALLPPLGAAYERYFALFGLTRNGVFFAPIFLLLGGMLARRPARRTPKQYAAALCGALALLIAEGVAVKQFNLAHFDALYLSLPLCVALLILWLRGLDLDGRPSLRTWAAAVYVLHPLCIVLVRGGAKVLGLTALLVECSPVHYLAVVLLSGALALPFALWGRRRGRAAPPRRGRAWTEIDLDALRHNAAALSALLPEGCSLMAVVKADAYGHGARETARACARAGIHAFAVATAEEGVQLRRAGIKGEILVLGYSGPEYAPLLSRCRLTQAVVSAGHARALDGAGFPLRVYLKVDTGMHRLGIPWDDAGALEGVFACRSLRVCGMFTHLAAAETLDEAGEARTQEQIRRFYYAAQALERAGHAPGALHIQSSYGLLNYGPLPCAYVRAGISLYGVYSAPGDRTRTAPALRPVLSLRARVAQVHTLEAGESAGYDGAYVARRPSRVALLTVGYADGYPRACSCGRGRVLLHGQYAPVAGLVCMDQLLVDITDIPGVEPGDVATLIGRDGDQLLTAEEVAGAAGTITNELLSRMGGRLERVFLASGGNPG